MMIMPADILFEGQDVMKEQDVMESSVDPEKPSPPAKKENVNQ